MNEMKYSRIISAAMAAPWAILPTQFAIIREMLTFRATGGQLSADEIAARAADGRSVYGQHTDGVRSSSSTSSGKGVMVLSLVGVVIPRLNVMAEMSGSVSVQRFTQDFRAALADPDIGAIVIDVDSPGGQVTGVAELAREIYAARGQKLITAVANGMAASAAYWIASAADELVVIPSGDVGSIGVLTLHQDLSGAAEQAGVNMTYIHAGKYKVEGNPFEPLGDEARAHIQSQIDHYYGMFTSDVAAFRNTSVERVSSGFGEGRMVHADAAIGLGMADRVATLDDVVDEFIDRLAADGSASRNNFNVQDRKRRLTANSR